MAIMATDPKRLRGVRSAARVPAWDLSAKVGVPVHLPEGAWVACVPGEATEVVGQAHGPRDAPCLVPGVIRQGSGPIHFTMGKNSGLGDKICALSAVREFARRNPGRAIFFDELKPVIEAFGDGLVKYEKPGVDMFRLLDCEPRFRVKWSSPDLNLVGCFMAHLGMKPDGRRPELPPVSEILPRGSYVTVQPLSTHSRNPDPSWIQGVVDEAKRETGLPAILVGSSRTKRFLKGVNESFLVDSPLQMMSLVRWSRLHLCPRSASSLVAASYNVRTVVWESGDGEGWLIDFRGWNATKVKANDVLPNLRVI
jgi:hypothetical protein